MRKIIAVFFLILLIACNKENTNNCLQTTGEIIQREFVVPNFDKIVVMEKVELILTQGPEQKVIFETGKNLMTDVTAEVVDNELTIANNNTCNLFRDYGITKVYVTAPNISVIRNASEQNVSSNGVLTYPSLYLRSSGEKSNLLAVGDFHLNIENEVVTIWANGIATFFIEGNTTNLSINFSDGDTRFEGKNFKANNISVINVSSNDMLIYPIESLMGNIHSTGDVISYNRPPIVTVYELSVGRLIFKP